MADKPTTPVQDAKTLGLSSLEGTKVADILKGGQFGAGFNALQMDASTPAVFNNSVIVVLQTPTMWDNNPEDPNNNMAKMCKMLCESHAKSVTGIDFGYTIDAQSQPIGHDGQEFEVPTKTKRSAVSPSFTFPELTGNLVWNFFKQWAFDINHPDTNAAMARFTTSADKNKHYVSSQYSMTIAVIQFSPSMEPDEIIDCAFISNMWPKDPGGQFGFERTVGQAKVPERSVSFSGIVQHNNITKKLGIEIASKLQLQKVQYSENKTALTDVNKNIQASGLKLEVDSLLGSNA